MVHNKFIGVRSVEKTDASHILAAIEHMMMNGLNLEPDQWYKKIVGFGSDGASVMIGKNAGVVSKIKAKQPCIQAVHCYGRRKKRCMVLKLGIFLNIVISNIFTSSLNCQIHDGKRK